MPYLRRQQGTASEREGGPNAPFWISKASSLCAKQYNGPEADAHRSETPALKQYGLLQKLQSLYFIQPACSCFTGQGLYQCFCNWRNPAQGVEIGCRRR